MIMLIIDPQMDFHPPNGTLGVPGAQEDSERTAAFIREHIDEIDDIFVTLDSHHVYLILSDFDCLLCINVENAHCSWSILVK